MENNATSDKEERKGILRDLFKEIRDLPGSRDLQSRYYFLLALSMPERDLSERYRVVQKLEKSLKMSEHTNVCAALKRGCCGRLGWGF